MTTLANSMRSCLFCRNQDLQIHSSDAEFYVVCRASSSGCQARGPIAASHDEAIRLWNLPDRPWEEQFRSHWNTPLYLTNGCCEHAHGDADMFRALGLNHGQFDGEFYPLTATEAPFIAEDTIDALDDHKFALTGYSALYRNRKYIMPSIELAFGRDLPSKDTILAEACDYARRIRPKIESMDGEILIDDNADPDRIIIQILVPFERVIPLGDRAAWNKRLQWLMLDPANTERLNMPPVRHENQNFAVEVEYIGEGRGGDYDPSDPDDRPLLRFWVERRADADSPWEDVDRGSYCTAVPAYAPRAIVEALPRYIANQLHMPGGAFLKSLLERLSSTSSVDIETFLKEGSAPDITD